MAEIFGKICDKYIQCHCCDNHLERDKWIAHLNLYFCDQCHMPIIIIPSSYFPGQWIQSRLISFEDQIIYHPYQIFDGEIKTRNMLFKEPMTKNFIYFDEKMKYNFKIDSEFFETLPENIKKYIRNEKTMDELIETAMNIADSDKYEAAFNIIKNIKNDKYIEIRNFYEKYSLKYIETLNNEIFSLKW